MKESLVLTMSSQCHAGCFSSLTKPVLTETECHLHLQIYDFLTGKLPEIGCSYVSPDQCTGFTPPSCCERINDDDDDDKDDDNDDRDALA